MYKTILSLGIIFLFTFSVATPIVIGNCVTKSNQGLLIENFNEYDVSDLNNYNNKQLESIPSQESIPSIIEKTQNPLYYTTSGHMGSPWPMYCYDARHTGSSPYSTSSNSGFEKWWFKSEKGYIEGSAAIDDDGIIYFGSWCHGKDNFFALYPNGTLKWKYNLGGNVEDTGPAIDENGIIYVGTAYNTFSGDRLFAFYPNGTVKWTYFTEEEIFSSPAVADDGTIFFGHNTEEYPWTGYITALYPNGTLKWRYKTNDVIYSDPAIGPDGTIYCGSHDNYLYALYPDNGTLKWKYKTGHWVRVSPCIGDDGTIYVVSLDNHLHAINPNGTLKWKTNMGNAGTSPTIGQDGTIYCGYKKLFAVNPINGSVKWTFDVGGTIRGGTPCNSIDGTIYVGTSDGGKIIAINPDGTEKWQQNIGKCEFAPVIGEDGTVYIGTSVQEEIGPGSFDLTGYLYAFNEMDSNAPSKPVINGPREGAAKTEIKYTFKSTSPLGNDVYYYIDWGDGDWRKDWWLGPYRSNENAVISHIWSEPGPYNIRTRCKDSDNLWSDWSELKVTIPRNRVSMGSVWLRFMDMFPILQRILSYIL